MPITWVLIGAGRCGLQLARAMVAAGVEVVGVDVRSPASRRRARRALPGIPRIGPGRPLPPCGGILLAVPDSAISACASALGPRLHPNTRVALHTSGLRPAAALALFARRGLRKGSLHPLVSFPSATGPAVTLGGAIAAVEGDPTAVRAARGLARRLGMRPVLLARGSKALYHAAAVIGSNLTHVLTVTAITQLRRAGLERPAAVEGLRALIGGSVAAALVGPGMRNLTGPLARGDAEAVQAHLGVLPAEVAAAYRAVARLAVSALAAAQVLDGSQVRALTIALTE